MALSFSRPDPSQPSSVSSASFALSRRGFDQAEVRDFLRMVAAELARLQERERFLEHELRSAQRSGPSPAAALDEEVVTRLLGEEAARILQTARDGASTIRQRAEEHATRLLREATDEAHRIVQDAENEAQRTRQDASSDAESELSMAKQHGREMVVEVRAYRERVLGELARRRELAREQIEQLVHGRDRLVQAFERARIAAVDVLGELAPLIEPDEYVNLSPTTGPVPLMVPNTPPPPQRRGPAFSETEPSAEHAAGGAEAGTAVVEVPDPPAVVPPGQSSRAVRDTVDEVTTRDESRPSAGEAVPEHRDEVPTARVFDVEVDDPELAASADDLRPAAAVAPRRKVPGVIERPAPPDAVVDTADGDSGASATVDDATTSAEAPATSETSAVEPSPAEPVTVEPVAVEPVTVEPVTVEPAGLPADVTSVSSEDAATDDGPTPAANPAGDTTAKRPPRQKRTAPLPRETIVTRPTPTSTPSSTAAAVAGGGARAADDDRPLAPVVSIFGGGSQSAREADAGDDGVVPPPPAAPSPPKSTVDDLFARLRAARTETVAGSVTADAVAPHPSLGDAAPAASAAPASTAERPARRRREPSATPDAPAPPSPTARPSAGTSTTRTSGVPAVLQPSPPEPVAEVQEDDSVFGRRETALAPLIQSAGRALKRVLADEQNDVLAVLRRREAVRSLDAVVPAADEHIARYAGAVADELRDAAIAGAASVADGDRPALAAAVAAGGAVIRATELLANQLVDPLRERLDRAIADAGGANSELAESLRSLYREWKTRHVDARADEAVRVAFGHGALAAVAPGTKVCWLVDPNGPACADADDNALGGPVSAGQPFPTDHLCAPAHAGCRCMLAKADR